MTHPIEEIHHQHDPKGIHSKHAKLAHNNKLVRFYDHFIYIIVVAAPIANLPQLFKIWIEKDASGVSAISWFLFSVMSVSWLIYGLLHKNKHILLMNGALMLVQAFIAIGAVIYN